MSDRLVVSTRKGLFWVERSGGDWRVAASRLSRRQRHARAARPPQRQRLRRAQPRTFRRQAASPGKRPLDGDRRAGLSAEAGRPRRPRRLGQGHPLQPDQHLLPRDRRPRGGRPPLVRDDPRRPLPLARPWSDMGAHPLAVGQPEASAMDGRRHGLAGDPFDLRRSARQRDRADRHFLRRRVGDARRRKRLGMPRRRHVRRLPAARDGPRPERAGPALPGAEPERARPPVGRSITTASSAATTPRRAGARSPTFRPPPSASPSPSIRASRTRPGSCRRSRTSAASRSTASSSSPAPATPARHSRSCGRACRRITPMTSSTAMRWRSTRPATGSPSPPRPAGSTSAKTRATAGGRSRHSLPPAHAVRFIP